MTENASDLRLVNDVETVNWDDLVDLYARAPLGRRDIEKLQRAFRNCYRVCLAYVGAELVGGGRMISDGEYYAAIYDVAVLPDFQGRGIGFEIMKDLMKELDLGSIILVSVPGKEGFYRKLGFDKLMTGMGRYRLPEMARESGYIE
jgi:ribosomal protein S18 acetylase RimI-like enzyme